MGQGVQARDQSKIWIVAPTPPPYGGMSVQATMQATRLAGEGIDVEVISTNPRLRLLPQLLVRLPVVRTILREVQYLSSLTRIIRNPGVVHHFSASYLYFFLHSVPLVLLRAWPGVKIVLNYRGGQLSDFLHRWGWAALPFIKRADVLVVPSEFLQRVFKTFGLQATILPNLASTDLFPFVERGHFAPRFLVTRSLEPMYDVECVLRAFHLIQSQIPEALLGIVGTGSESARLRRVASNQGLRNVTFYGALPHEDLPSVYQQHDVYMNASRVDNFPGALVEAACSGLPIVTTRAGGIPQMIRDDDNGLLCDVGDSQSLANAALEIVHRPEMARRLARSARSWAEQFSWQAIYPQLLHSYGFSSRQASPAPVAESGILVH
jgi:glycosyltransferase involved in cell wall biosynthesis